MKKILTLLLALWMLTGCVAMAAENQLVVGSTTAMSGAFFTDLFGSNTADMDVRALLHGYNLMSWDNETGTYQTEWNQLSDSDSVVFQVSGMRRKSVQMYAGRYSRNCNEWLDEQ